MNKKAAQGPIKTRKAEMTEKPMPQYFEARARYVWYSPYKLRPIADVVRGTDVSYALQWLRTYKTKRAESIRKTIESAVANAKNRASVDAAALTVKEIRIDQGPTHRYFKPSAMGRSAPQRKRLSHVSVILGTKA
jgi:large subunit ribosomal protein L22